jgi:hypothetical protein
MLVLTPSVLKFSSSDDKRESLFHYETPVVERSAPGYRIAPSHLIFTEPTLLCEAARFAVTSPLAVKPRCRRAWRSHGRYRVRKRSSRIAVASLPLLCAAARINAGRSHGRHCMHQRNSRAAVLSPPLDSPAPPQQYALRSPPKKNTRLALPRVPPRAAMQQPRRRPLPPRRRLPLP